jgi:hypothetical protein
MLLDAVDGAFSICFSEDGYHLRLIERQLAHGIPLTDGGYSDFKFSALTRAIGRSVQLLQKLVLECPARKGGISNKEPLD